MSTRFQKAGMLLLIFFLFYSAQWFQSEAQKKRPFLPEIEAFLQLPDSKILKISSLGFNTSLADYLWIKLILKMGQSFILEEYEEHLSQVHDVHHGENILAVPTQKDSLIVFFLQNQLEPSFFDYIDKITDLDPQFAYPYLTGFTFEMFYYENKERAVYFLKKAMKNIPEYWEFPFYYGFYLFQFKHAPDSVILPYLIKSAHATRGIRVFDRKIAESMLEAFLKRASREEKSKHFLISIFKSLGDEKLKQKFLKYLKQERIIP